MIKKLRMKFVFITMGIVFAMLLVIFVTVYQFTEINLREQSTELLQRLSESAHNPFSFQEPDRDMKLPYFSVKVNLHGGISASGYSYYDLTDDAFVQELVQRVYLSQQTSGLLKEYDLRYTMVSGLNSQTIFFVDISSQQAALSALVRVCIFIGVLSLIVFFGISLLLAQWAVKPVEKAWKQQGQFVSDASHELKTPLTVIVSNAELLENPDTTPEEKNRFAQNILTMSQRMRSLVEGLLELTRADNGQTQKSFDTVDLSRLVEDAVLPFEPMLFEKGQQLQSNIQQGISMVGSSQHLMQILDVLLDNAAKYADPGLVTVKLERQGRGNCLLTVASPGNPIPKEKLESIFDRFSRCDTARAGDGSFGLGLSIAKSLTENHGGKIWAESNPTGNCFFVRLPCL